VAKNGRALKGATIAYFSAEFGLHESLRIYSGGLGILAGDHAKSASDLGLPLAGITLFYRQGYFQQVLSGDGWQQERYPSYDPARLPITPVTDSKGKPISCTVEIGNDPVRLQAWAIQVGRIKLYLLDTDLPENDQKYRELTAHVYGGDNSTRIAQEIILGIGGVRMLRAMMFFSTMQTMLLSRLAPAMMSRAARCSTTESGTPCHLVTHNSPANDSM